MLNQMTLTDSEVRHLEAILKDSVKNAEGLDKRFTESLLDRLIESQSFEPHASLR